MAHQFQYHEKINPMIQAEANTFARRPRKHPREDVEHEQVMSWARIQKFRGGKVADFLHHSPNGGKRSKSEAAKFKRMGTQAGFPDFWCYVPLGGFHGLYVELKAHDGKLSPQQRLMLAKLEEQGYCCKVCYGFEQAKREICKYLGLGEG